MRIPFTNIQIGGSSNLRSLSSDFLKGNFQSIGSSRAGVSITKDNSLSISSVYTAVKIYSDAIGMLPTSIFQDLDGSRTKLKNHPLHNLVSKEPNSLMTRFVFFQIVIPHLCLWGNSFSAIEFSKGSFRPKSIMPIHPKNFKKAEIISGVLYYTFNIDGTDIVLDQSNVIHFRGMGDEFIGKSVIDHAKDNLGLGKAAEDFGSTFFGNGANMNGVLSSDKELSDKAYNNLKKSLDDRHGGISNSNKMLLLEEGLKFSNTSIPPDSAQFLETRKFSVTDVARWFKLPPHLLGDLERATFSNIEEQDLNFVKHSILPYVVNIEEEMNRKLLRESEKRDLSIKMNIDGLLRGDIKTRFEAHKIAVQNAIKSPNEIRSLEGMNSYKGGDSYWMQTNTAPVDKNGTNQQSETNEKN